MPFFFSHFSRWLWRRLLLLPLEKDLVPVMAFGFPAPPLNLAVFNSDRVALHIV
jgi:hypothetical protein